MYKMLTNTYTHTRIYIKARIYISILFVLLFHGDDSAYVLRKSVYIFFLVLVFCFLASVQSLYLCGSASIH